MPRLPRIQHEPLQEFLDGQRYTPKAALRKQIERAMELGLEVDGEEHYSGEWIIRRITGYTPSLEAGWAVRGDLLIADLAALVDHLCARAGMSVGDAPQGSIDIEALAARWGVSRRTVERYRRRGLIALRVGSGRTARLLFPPASVAAFEIAHPDLLERAKRFERMSDAERARAIELVRGAASAKVASAAEGLGRSRGAVRRAVRGEAGVATRLKPKERALAGRAIAWGVSPGEVGARLGVTAGAVGAASRRWRIDRLIGALDAEALAGRRAIPRAADAPLERLGVGGAATSSDLAAISEGGARSPTPAVELAQWSGLWAMLGECARELVHLKGTPKASQVDAIETRALLASRLLATLVIGEQALIVRTVESQIGGAIAARSPREIDGLWRCAVSAAARAIVSAEPPSDGRSRLASPIALAVNREIAPLARRLTARGAGRARSSGVELSIVPGVTPILKWQRVVEPHPGIVGVLDRLDALDRRYLELRYAVGGSFGAAPVCTLEACEKLSISPQRAAGAVRRARRVIREAIHGPNDQE